MHKSLEDDHTKKKKEGGDIRGIMRDAWRFNFITVFEKSFLWVLATRASYQMQYLENIVPLVGRSV